MLIDSATIICHGGQGGDGCNSFEQARHPHKKPNGGDGGHGGSVFLVARSQIRTLLDLQVRKTFHAEDGNHGSSNNKTGAVGGNIRLDIPLGTEVYDERTGHLLKDMCVDGEELLVTQGGAGGKGNHRRSGATHGDPGEARTIRLELKLIADVGLVGFPNAGKSTLISRVSNARSKIAAYPFTTKEPILGVVKVFDGETFVVADIPGLIKGAHEGKGLGDRFLRHIERTKVFLHLIDMAGVDGRDPVEDYRVINEELKGYSRDFASKTHVVVVNKMDIPEARENLVKFKSKVAVPVHEISAVTGEGLPELMTVLYRHLEESRKAST